LCVQTSPRGRSREFSNAPHGDRQEAHFRITHPFHPLFDGTFKVVSCRQNWGEDRVWFYDREHRLASIPTSWTDIAAPDRFVVVADGRSLFRVTDLLELVQRIRSLEASRCK
jgi:hypothetical protein